MSTIVSQRDYAPFYIMRIWNVSLGLFVISRKRFFSRGGARWYTSEHRLQIHLQQPIQEIWIHSRYLGDAKLYEEYDDKKISGARALLRAPVEYSAY